MRLVAEYGIKEVDVVEVAVYDVLLRIPSSPVTHRNAGAA